MYSRITLFVLLGIAILTVSNPSFSAEYGAETIFQDTAVSAQEFLKAKTVSVTTEGLSTDRSLAALLSQAAAGKTVARVVRISRETIWEGGAWFSVWRFYYLE